MWLVACSSGLSSSSRRRIQLPPALISFLRWGSTGLKLASGRFPSWGAMGMEVVDLRSSSCLAPHLERSAAYTGNYGVLASAPAFAPSCSSWSQLRAARATRIGSFVYAAAPGNLALVELAQANGGRHPCVYKHDGCSNIGGTTHGLNCIELNKSVDDRCGGGTKLKAINLLWTPYLESKFASALDLLGEGATPQKIQLVMNIKSNTRKHISTHLQKHRKKIEKKLRNRNGNIRQYDPVIQLNDKTHVEMASDQTGNFTKETEGNKVYYEAMQRALRFGVVFDELQLIRNEPSSEEANRGEVDRADSGDAQVDNTFAFGDINAVVSEETRSTDGAKEVSKVANSCRQVPCAGDQTGVVKLVAYSDSEDNDIDP